MSLFFAGLHERAPLHASHRGGAALAPENTLVAFREAVGTWRTDLLELYVQLTRDDVVVVCHDATVDRCTDGRGDVRDHTLAELQRLDAGFHFSRDGGRTFPFRGKGVRIPTLREVLETFGAPALRFNIDVKREFPGIEERVAEELRRASALSRVCVGTVDDAQAARLVELLPECAHFYPRDALVSFVLAVRAGETPPEDARFTVLDVPLRWNGMTIVDDALIAAARAHGKWVNVWTVDEPDDMRALIALGVGGIMTDRPDLLRQVLGG